MATVLIFSNPDHLPTACLAVLAELRPHLAYSALLNQIERQITGGYRLAALEVDGDIKAVAGFRFGEFLAWGRIMYVDDLVVKESERGKGYGGQLLEWLKAHARENGCEQFHLDSGAHRLDAHRFYKTHGMELSSYHFGMRL